jgi:hypothetical protein
MFFNNTKGQSALEFLTTYGWAFMVALMIIAALSYSGILNPNRYLPDKCTFGSQIYCSDYLVSQTDNQIRLSLVNNIGEKINLTSAQVYTPQGTIISCDTPLAVNDYWKDSYSNDLLFTNCGDLSSYGLIQGDKSKVYFSLTYYAIESAPEYDHKIIGELFSKIE